MGLLNLFKKRKNTHLSEETSDTEQFQKKKPNISYSYTKEGILTIDFYDDEPSLSQTYDSIRLAINPVALQIENQDIYNCMVSWYYDDSCYAPSECGSRIVSDGQENILAQIDLQLIRLDPEYVYILMKKILNKNNVIGHVEDGLKENSARPCGNYVGGIIEDDVTGEYQEYFSKEVGKAVHNSTKMIERRERYRNQLKEKASQFNYSSSRQMDPFSR